MKTQTYAVFVPQWKTDPSSWVRPALFPQHLTPDEIDAGEFRLLSVEQDAFLREVRRHVDDYLLTNRPFYNSVCATLAVDAMYYSVRENKADEGCWTWAGDKDALFGRLLQRGIGAHEYLRSVMCRETHVGPSLTVVAMEAHCRKYNLRRFRAPSGDGEDIEFSYDPIDNPVFDNHKYIPSSVGYYTIIGTGSARD